MGNAFKLSRQSTFEIDSQKGSPKMRPMLLVGLILVVAGIIAVAVPSITFFTRERIADVGFFAIDVSRPHTFFLNPAVGIIVLAVGAVLTMMGLRSDSK
jgi:hypothetical protein